MTMIPLECTVKSMMEWRIVTAVINNEAENAENIMIRFRWLIFILRRK